MSHPAPLPQPQDVWSRFSSDPRSNPELRASDADRNVVLDVLNAAFQDGRLDVAEHAERVEQALAVKRLADLPALVSDLVADPSPAPATVRAASTGRSIQGITIAAWFGLAVLVNLIWAATWLAGGDAPTYYWPIWPMIGTLVPTLVLWLVGTGLSARDAQRELERDARREQRHDRRDARRDERHDRRDARRLGP